ncbi:MAG: DUF285 domain-containing protein [Paludibacteraceae bacterium]|nr:DUF285 domain-containing protein [Paludibacteraceae bacterium]
MKKTKLFLLFVLTCFVAGAYAQKKEVYSSFKESKGTLTYYYDDQRAARESSGEVTVIYNPDVWGFKDFSKKVKVAKIDASMTDAHLRSTKKMFFQLNNIEEIQNIENLITDDVVNMDSMFYGCSSLTSLDLSDFKTDKVTSMACMFTSCSSLRSFDLSSFSTANVTNMRRMFDFCGMKSLDLSNFNTSKVTNMREMFSDCHNLRYLDINSFDISNVEDIDRMFLRCYQLVTIHCEQDWSIYNPNNEEGLFVGCTLLIGDQGTECEGLVTDVDINYARLDGLDGKRGYFSTKHPVLKPIVYTQYDRTANTLTYFYDNEYGTREGILEKYNLKITRFDHYNIESVNIAIIDPSMKDAHLATTSKMFYGDENHTLKNMTQIQGMENLVTDEVMDMSRMFMCCSSLQSIDLSHFSTGKVQLMTAMFNNCIALTSLDLGSFDTQNVTKMSYMFTGCEGLESLNISSFNTANVTDMSNMFNNCWNLKSLDVSGFNTENVTNMSYMFAACSGLTALYVNSFTTRNVTDMTYMFYECSELTTILASSDWSKNAAPNVKSNGMFSSCGKILGGNGTQYSETNVSIEYARPDGVTGAGYFTPVPEFYTEFDDASATLTYYYDNQRAAHDGICETFFPMTNYNDHEHYAVRFEGYADKVKKAVVDESVGSFRMTALGSLFYGGREANSLTALETIEGLDNFNCTDVTSTYAMFKGCSSLLAVDLKGLAKATKLKVMQSMFQGCSSLKSIDLSWLNTFNTTDMTCMFEGCSSLESLDMTPLNTAKVESMINLFRNCSSLKSINLSKLKTSDLSSMSRMFEGCSSLTSLDLSSFKTGDVLTTDHMFMGCSSLETLDLRSFNTSNVENMYSMFSGCTALTTLDLRSFTIEKLTEADYMFGGCTSLTTILCNGDWTKSHILERCENMFGGCTSLVGGYGSVCDGMYHTDRTYARPDKGNGSGYFTAQNEVYTEFDASTSTLTYYCDTLRLTRSGITELYIPEHAAGIRFGYSEDVQYAVLDETMSSARLTSMRNMFYGGSKYDDDLDYEFHYKLSNMKEIDGLEYLNTDNVTDMSGMFFGCASIDSLDLAFFNTDNVTDMRGMFSGCTKLAAIRCKFHWDESEKLALSEKMFEGCTSLTGGKGTKCDGENNIDKTYARPDKGEKAPGYFTTVNEQYTVFNEEKGTLTYYYDDQCLERKGIVEMYTPTKGDAIRFEGYADKVKKAVVHKSFKNIIKKSLALMFYGGSSSTCLSAMESIEGLENLRTEKVTDAHDMFLGCRSLKEVDVTPLITSKVKNFRGMFYDCRSLKEVDVDGFDIGKVKNMNSMFANCTSLATIWCSNDWDTSSAASYDMFYNCPLLKGGRGTAYNESHIDKTYARFDGGKSGPGYFSMPLYRRFTINGDGGQIQFSPGNLQYNFTTETCHFAPHQWDYVGEGNLSSVAANGPWLDLFGWGTGNYLLLGSPAGSDYETFTEWGKNKIDDYAPNTWRTPTKAEWNYLFHTRPDASSKYGAAKVNDVGGLVILPDVWKLPAGCDFTPGMVTGGYDWYYATNVYSATQWAKMEKAGAIFLPAAGYRYYNGNKQVVSSVTQVGHYWSSDPTHDVFYQAWDIYFTAYSLDTENDFGRYFGSSVRLVRGLDEQDEPEELEPLPENETTTFDFSLIGPDGSKMLGVTLDAKDEYNAEEGRMEVTSTNTADEIDTKLNAVYNGTGSIKPFLPGTIIFKLGQGEGKIEIDCQTVPGYTLQVRIAEYGEAFITSTIEQAQRGKATVSYNVTQETYVVIYLEGAPGSAPARIARSAKEEGAGAYIWSITIIPAKTATGIEALENGKSADGKFVKDGILYILHDGRLYNAQGAEIR